MRSKLALSLFESIDPRGDINLATTNGNDPFGTVPFFALHYQV